MTMRGFVRTFALMAASLGATAQNAELSQIHTVYLLPMGNGFDQYLANRLTQLGPYRVVTDPKLADAVFTERLGEAFEIRFLELFPPAEPPAPESPAPEPPKDAEVENKEETSERSEVLKSEGDEQQARTLRSTFGRGKGTLFLVSRNSRQVVWSAFENPKAITPEVLDSTAQRAVRQLKRDLAGK